MMVISAGAVIFADGSIHRDQNVVIEDGIIVDIVASTSIYPDAHFAVVTPGFHNGHSHCEYQLLSGIVPTADFFPWVRDVVRIKAILPSHFWEFSSFVGVMTLLRMGYISTADCSESGYSPAIMKSLGLQGICYREVNGLNPDTDVARCEAVVDDVLKNLSAFPLGIAPHAVYSTCQKVLERIQNRCFSLPMCIHTDESPDEERFCRFGDGQFAEMYERRGIKHPSPKTSAVQYFEKEGFLSNQTLLVHGCNWDESDIDLVKRSDASVAICPESNEYLRCHPSPVLDLYANRIPTTIGTDSALSCISMSPIHQLCRLMSRSSDEHFHKWLFHAQVTPSHGTSYDLRIGEPASFCAYGKDKPAVGGSLSNILADIKAYTPHIFRLGVLKEYECDIALEAQMRDIVKVLT